MGKGELKNQKWISETALLGAWKQEGEPRDLPQQKADPGEDRNSFAMMISQMLLSLTVWKSDFLSMT